MSLIQLSDKVTSDNLNSLVSKTTGKKFSPQCKQLLKYIIKTKGYNQFERSSFEKELNLHQNDTEVFETIPSGIISTTFKFYMSTILKKEGWVLVEDEPTKKDEVERLQKRIEFLELLLIENDISIEE